MKIKSTIELNYSAGREGIKKGIVELTLTVNKNTDSKIININIVDSIVGEVNTDNVSPIPMTNRVYVFQSSDSYSYKDFDDMLLTIKGQGTYKQTGSELEDVLLQEYLLSKASTGKWYGSVPENWIKI